MAILIEPGGWLVCTHPKEGADRELSPKSSVIELPMGYRRDPGSFYPQNHREA